MGLYERLLHLEDRHLSWHALEACLQEIERGKLTIAQAVAVLALSAAEQIELETLVARTVPPLETISLGGFVTLTNVGTAYDTINAAFGLGFCRLESFGISGFEFRVGMNRNGATGTISWQLWDETNAQEVAVIDDVSGTGNKYVAVTRTFGSPLAAGIRIVRVRAKSTTGTDDPLYLGANLLIRRVESLTPEIIGKIGYLASQDGSPYATVAAVKSRLGV